ncbi:MAG: 2-oxoacid:acceptor oxidoreductase subunit alpha [Patescibacteria group bacterium]
MDRFTWKIGGPAGFGIATSGQLFARMCAASGRFVADYSEKPNRIRGGHNTHQVTMADKPLYAASQNVDLLVALDRDTIFSHVKELNRHATIMYDGEQISIKTEDVGGKDVTILSVPLTRFAKEVGGEEVMRNTVAIGASLAFMGCEFTPLESVINTIFRKKPERLAANLKAAREGFDYVHTQGNLHHTCPLALGASSPHIVIPGNEAVALGAIQAGCTFYAAYPMSPSSSILHYLASKAETTGMVVKHAEDEISVINMALGASFAGARAMIGTSGGGFSLMVESLGLAGIAEIPLVIAEVMRPGPATGMPTWTESSDLQFVIHAAQGEFPRAVFAPGDVEEAFHHTLLAFNLADRWQVPVFLLSDKNLGEHSRSVAPLTASDYRIDRGKLLTQKELSGTKPFKRYAITADGASPRPRPGLKGGVYLSNSYEHDEYGYSDESSEMRKAQANKRMKKMESIVREMPKPLLIGPDKAALTLVTWGSMKGPVREAMERLMEEKKKVNMIHFSGMWPFPKQEAEKLLSAQNNLVLIENNATAQFGSLLKEQIGIEIRDKLLKYDGRPWFPEEIIQETKKWL